MNPPATGGLERLLRSMRLDLERDRADIRRLKRGGATEQPVQTVFAPDDPMAPSEGSVVAGAEPPPLGTYPGGSNWYHHDQEDPAEVWEVPHGLPYRPAGVYVHDDDGEIRGHITYGDRVLWIAFYVAGEPFAVAGQAEVS